MGKVKIFKCVVPGCHTKSSDNKTFSKFPPNYTSKFYNWLQIIGIKTLKTRRNYICKSHFAHKCFTNLGLLRLNSVPSIFPNKPISKAKTFLNNLNDDDSTSEDLNESDSENDYSEKDVRIIDSIYLLNKELIEEVKSHELLYNRRHTLFYNQNKKEKVWKKIAQKLNSDVEICKMYWEKLMDNYLSAAKANNWHFDEIIAENENPWKLYESLKFLQRHFQSFSVKRKDIDFCSGNEIPNKRLCVRVKKYVPEKKNETSIENVIKDKPEPVLSYKTKLYIIQLIAEGIDIAEIEKQFNLKKETVKRLYKNAETVREHVEAKAVITLEDKKIKKMEEILTSWVCNMNNKRLPLNSKIIKNKAKNIYYNENLFEETVNNVDDNFKLFNASDQWFKEWFDKHSKLHDTKLSDYTDIFSIPIGETKLSTDMINVTYEKVLKEEEIEIPEMYETLEPDPLNSVSKEDETQRFIIEEMNSKETNDHEEQASYGETDSKEFNEALIKEIKAWKILYDEECNNYSNITRKAKAWEAIAKKLNKNVEECKSRWRYLRINYLVLAKATNWADEIEGMNSFEYYKSLLFLREYIKPKKTEDCHNEETFPTTKVKINNDEFETFMQDKTELSQRMEELLTKWIFTKLHRKQLVNVINTRNMALSIIMELKLQSNNPKIKSQLFHCNCTKKWLTNLIKNCKNRFNDENEDIQSSDKHIGVCDGDDTKDVGDDTQTIEEEIAIVNIPTKDITEIERNRIRSFNEDIDSVNMSTDKLIKIESVSDDDQSFDDENSSTNMPTGDIESIDDDISQMFIKVEDSTIHENLFITKEQRRTFTSHKYTINVDHNQPITELDLKQRGELLLIDWINLKKKEITDSYIIFRAKRILFYLRKYNSQGRQNKSWVPNSFWLKDFKKRYFDIKTNKWNFFRSLEQQNQDELNPKRNILYHPLFIHLKKKQKLDVILLLEQGCKPLQVADKFNIAVSTVYRIYVQVDMILSEILKDSPIFFLEDNRKLLPELIKKMEESLNFWIFEMNKIGTYVDQTILKREAISIFNQLKENSNNPDDSELEFAASSYWFKKYMKRYPIEENPADDKNIFIYLTKIESTQSDCILRMQELLTYWLIDINARQLNSSEDAIMNKAKGILFNFHLKSNNLLSYYTQYFKINKIWFDTYVKRYGVHYDSDTNNWVCDSKTKSEAKLKIDSLNNYLDSQSQILNKGDKEQDEPSDNAEKIPVNVYSENLHSKSVITNDNALVKIRRRTKHVCVPLKIKIEIKNLFDKGRSLTYIANRFKKLPKSAILKEYINSHKPTDIDHDSLTLSQKELRKVQSDFLLKMETELTDWVDDTINKKSFISKNDWRFKAKDIFEELKKIPNKTEDLQESSSFKSLRKHSGINEDITNMVFTSVPRTNVSSAIVTSESSTLSLDKCMTTQTNLIKKMESALTDWMISTKSVISKNVMICQAQNIFEELKQDADTPEDLKEIFIADDVWFKSFQKRSGFILEMEPSESPAPPTEICTNSKKGLIVKLETELIDWMINKKLLMNENEVKRQAQSILEELKNNSNQSEILNENFIETWFESFKKIPRIKKLLSNGTISPIPTTKISSQMVLSKSSNLSTEKCISVQSDLLVKMEKALIAWMINIKSFLSENDLKCRAKTIFEEIKKNSNNPKNLKETFVADETWFEAFQKRYGIKKAVIDENTSSAATTLQTAPITNISSEMVLSKPAVISPEKCMGDKSDLLLKMEKALKEWMISRKSFISENNLKCQAQNLFQECKKYSTNPEDKNEIFIADETWFKSFQNRSGIKKVYQIQKVTNTNISSEMVISKPLTLSSEKCIRVQSELILKMELALTDWMINKKSLTSENDLKCKAINIFEELKKNSNNPDDVKEIFVADETWLKSFQNRFSIKKNITDATILPVPRTNVSSEIVIINSPTLSSAKCMSVQSNLLLQMETALSNWMINTKSFLSENDLKCKAVNIFEELKKNSNKPEDLKACFVPDESWLQAFQKRSGIKSVVSDMIMPLPSGNISSEMVTTKSSTLSPQKCVKVQSDLLLQMEIALTDWMISTKSFISENDIKGQAQNIFKELKKNSNNPEDLKEIFVADETWFKSFQNRSGIKSVVKDVIIPSGSTTKICPDMVSPEKFVRDPSNLLLKMETALTDWIISQRSLLSANDVKCQAQNIFEEFKKNSNKPEDLKEIFVANETWFKSFQTRSSIKNRITDMIISPISGVNISSEKVPSKSSTFLSEKCMSVESNLLLKMEKVLIDWIINAITFISENDVKCQASNIFEGLKEKSNKPEDLKEIFVADDIWLKSFQKRFGIKIGIADVMKSSVSNKNIIPEKVTSESSTLSQDKSIMVQSDLILKMEKALADWMINTKFLSENELKCKAMSIFEELKKNSNKPQDLKAIFVPDDIWFKSFQTRFRIKIGTKDMTSSEMPKIVSCDSLTLPKKNLLYKMEKALTNWIESTKSLISDNVVKCQAQNIFDELKKNSNNPEELKEIFVADETWFKSFQKRSKIKKGITDVIVSPTTSINIKPKMVPPESSPLLTDKSVSEFNNLLSKMEKKLTDWLHEMISTKSFISINAVKCKAKIIFDELKKHNNQLKDIKKVFIADDIWFKSYQIRAGIKKGSNDLIISLEKVASESPTLPLEKVTSGSPTLPLENVASESPTLPLEKVTSGSPTLPLEKVASESPTLPLEKVKFESPTLPLDKVTSEFKTLPLEKVTFESPALPLEKVTSESPTLPLEKVTSESPKLPLEKVTSECQTLPLQKVTSESPKLPQEKSMNELNDSMSILLKMEKALVEWMHYTIKTNSFLNENSVRRSAMFIFNDLKNKSNKPEDLKENFVPDDTWFKSFQERYRIRINKNDITILPEIVVTSSSTLPPENCNIVPSDLLLKVEDKLTDWLHKTCTTRTVSTKLKISRHTIKEKAIQIFEGMKEKSNKPNDLKEVFLADETWLKSYQKRSGINIYAHNIYAHNNMVYLQEIETSTSSTISSDNDMNVHSDLLFKMEKELTNWLHKMIDSKSYITENAVRCQAKHIFEELKKKSSKPEDLKEKFLADRFWFQSFQKRSGIHEGLQDVILPSVVPGYICMESDTLKSALMKQMEESLIFWMVDMNNKNLPVYAATIKNKAKSLFYYLQVNSSDLEYSKIKFIANENWFKSFIERYDIKNNITDNIPTYSAYYIDSKNKIDSSTIVSNPSQEIEVSDNDMQLISKLLTDKVKKLMNNNTEDQIENKTEINQNEKEKEKEKVENTVDEIKNVNEIIKTNPVQNNNYNHSKNKKIRKKVTFRSRISIKTKLKIIKLLEKNYDVKGVSDKFGFRHNTVHYIYKNADKIREAIKTSNIEEIENSVELRSIIIRKVEKLLIPWIKNRNKKNLKTSESLIRKKALDLFNDIQLKTKNFKSESFNASKGWFKTFKERYGIDMNLSLKLLEENNESKLKELKEVDDSKLENEKFEIKKENEEKDQPEKTSEREKLPEMNKKISGKSHKIGEDCQCFKYKCFEHINSSEREKIINNFNLGDRYTQDSYLAGLITLVPIKKHRGSNNNTRQYCYGYRIRLGTNDNINDITVCHKAFISIHGITNQRLCTIKESLRRTGLPPKKKFFYGSGKHNNRKCITAETREKIKTHIESLKGLRGHYSIARNNSKLYLPEELNIPKLHNMYSELNPIHSISLSKYKSIIKNDYNISFGYPRNDTCSNCEQFKILKNKLTLQNLTENQKSQIKLEFKEKNIQNKIHLNKVQTFYIRKKNAKNLAHNEETEAICFDFMKNLKVPNILTNDMYYHRQLNFYMFNVDVLTSGESFIFTYDETIAKKGSDDVISMLDYFFKNNFSSKVRNVHIFCDTCPNQSKNFTIIKFLHSLVNIFNRFDSIRITFPVQGHSSMEYDKNMGLIKQHVKIELPDEWNDHIKLSRPWRPFVVIKSKQDIFKNWTSYLENNHYKEKSPFATRISEILITKENNRAIQLRATYNGPWHSYIIRYENTANILQNLQPSYTGLIPISSVKYNDLMVLKKFCRDKAQRFFEALPHLKQISDTNEQEIPIELSDEQELPIELPSDEQELPIELSDEQELPIELSDNCASEDEDEMNFKLKLTNSASPCHSTSSSTCNSPTKQNNSNKRPRNAITLKQKLDIIQLLDKGDKASYIARQLGLPETTVRTIYKNSDKIRNTIAAGSILSSEATTKVRSGLMQRMEKLLTAWIFDMNGKNLPISSRIIQEKARSLFNDLKESSKIPEDAQQTFNASHGWFERFKRRSGLHNLKMLNDVANIDGEENSWTGALNIKDEPLSNEELIKLFGEDDISINEDTINSSISAFSNIEENQSQIINLDADDDNLDNESLGQPQIIEDNTNCSSSSDETKSDKNFPLENLTDAMKQLDIAMELFQKYDKDTNRSKTVRLSILESVECYRDIIQEKEKKILKNNKDSHYRTVPFSKESPIYMDDEEISKNPIEICNVPTE